MENASKALIIAGAILLAIIIISLGIMVVNNARSQIGGANLSKQEIEAFNSQWDAYCGDKKSASDVRSLCSAVISNNAVEQSNGSERYITVSGAGITINTTGTPTVPALSNAKSYTVTASSYTNGLVSAITVSQNNTSGSGSNGSGTSGNGGN